MKPVHLVCCLLIALVPNAFAAKKLNVTLYYESLCPYSRIFITDQLEPNYAPFKDYIKVDLVPYGIAKAYAVDDGISFKCQHGKPECAGNKAHSCGLYLAPNEGIAIKYASCAIHTLKYDECVKKSGLDYQKYQSCYTSELGTLLQLEAALETKKYAVPGYGTIGAVPTIVFNNVYSEDKADKSRSNFAKALCEEIKLTLGVRPEACT